MRPGRTGKARCAHRSAGPSPAPAVRAIARGCRRRTRARYPAAPARRSAPAPCALRSAPGRPAPVGAAAGHRGSPGNSRAAGCRHWERAPPAPGNRAARHRAQARRGSDEPNDAARSRRAGHQAWQASRRTRRRNGSCQAPEAGRPIKPPHAARNNVKEEMPAGMAQAPSPAGSGQAPSAFSIAWTSAGSSGAVRGLKRASTRPSGPSRNFSKFQVMSPGNSAPSPASRRYSG